MPIYTYQCPKCKKQGDFDLEMGHDTPHCGECKDKVELERQYGSVNFILKGGGWTEKTSQTIEKKRKLKKLWDDSQMGGGGDNPNFADLPPED